MNTKTIDSTLSISDQDLHSTLQEFLEDKEKKPKKSIWNATTISGLGLVLFSFAFVGYTIGTEFLGFTGFSIMQTTMKLAPYVGGVLLGLSVLSMFTFNKEKKELEKREEVKVQATYDKLDDFLYSSNEKKSRSKFAKRYSIPQSGKLMKSRTDKKIAGVCGGLAKHLGISSTMVRVIFLIAVFISSGSAIIAYLAMAVVMPKEPVSLMDDFN